MSTWNDPGWASQNPEIDVEHKRLNQMVASLAAVIRIDSGLGLSTEAIDILIERMKLHFALEERNAAQVDLESRDILHEDHALLLTRLDQVKQAMKGHNRDEASRRLQSFITALDKHDLEIDIPLFRMMAASTA